MEVVKIKIIALAGLLGLSTQVSAFNFTFGPKIFATLGLVKNIDDRDTIANSVIENVGGKEALVKHWDYNIVTHHSSQWSVINKVAPIYEYWTLLALGANNQQTTPEGYIKINIRDAIQQFPAGKYSFWYDNDDKEYKLYRTLSLTEKIASTLAKKSGTKPSAYWRLAKELDRIANKLGLWR